MELTTRAEDEDDTEEDEVPFLARRRPVVPWRRHGPKIVVHPEDMRRRLRSLPEQLRAELQLRTDQREVDEACDTLADAARWLGVPERELQNRTTEDFIEGCAQAGIPRTAQRKLEQLHIDLVGHTCVWATNPSGPEDPVAHRGAFYLSYPQRKSRDRSRYRCGENAAASTCLPGQLESQSSFKDGAEQKAGWQKISLESGDSFFWHERRNQVTYGRPEDVNELGSLVAGNSLRLHEALEIQDKPTMNEEAWKALPDDNPKDDHAQRKWNRKNKQQACRLRVSGLYPLHMALCKEAKPQLSQEILEHNQAACRVRAPDGRLPLHQALIHWIDVEDDLQREAQTELVRSILCAYPEACQVKEPLHGWLPLHCALRKRAAERLVSDILVYYPEACREEDSYGKTPLHYCATANTSLIATHNRVVVDNCRLVSFPIDFSKRESAIDLARYGLVTNGFSIHQLSGFEEHDKNDPDDNFEAVLERCGIAEDERREQTLSQQLVSKDTSISVLELNKEAAGKADETGKTPAYLSFYNCTDDNIRRAINYEAIRTSMVKDPAAEHAQLIARREKQEVVEARTKVENAEKQLAAAEQEVSMLRLELDKAKGQEEDAKEDVKMEELTYRTVKKKIQEFCTDESTSVGSTNNPLKKERLLEEKAEIERRVFLTKGKYRSFSKELAQITHEFEDALCRKALWEEELDQRQQDYEREEEEWQKANDEVQETQRIIDQLNAQEKRGFDERMELTAANRTSNRDLPTKTKSKYAFEWYQMRPAALIWLHETPEDREKREATAKADNRSLLEEELIEVHGMDKDTYGEVRKSMHKWYEAYVNEKTSEGVSAATIEFEEEELIALWVYSMGPGATELPNFCECGYRDTQLLIDATVAAEQDLHADVKSAEELCIQARQDIENATLLQLRDRAEKVGIDKEVISKWKERIWFRYELEEFLHLRLQRRLDANTVEELLRRFSGNDDGEITFQNVCKLAMRELQHTDDTTDICKDNDSGRNKVRNNAKKRLMNDTSIAKNVSCSCPRGPKNFKIFDKFNSCMRSMRLDDTCLPKYRRFHYYLRRACMGVPGVSKNTDLFRGQDDFYGQDYSVGTIAVWKGYTSTTTDENAAVSFLSEPTPDTPNPVLFKIIGATANLGASLGLKPKGFPCALSAWPQEKEILLPAGASFRVQKKEERHKKQWTDKGRWMITLEYLGQWKRPEERKWFDCLVCCCGSPTGRIKSGAAGSKEVMNSQHIDTVPLRSLELANKNKLKLPQMIDFDNVKRLSGSATQHRSLLGKWHDVSVNVTCGSCEGKQIPMRHKPCPRSLTSVCNAALLHLYNKQLEAADKLKHELTVWSPSPALFSVSKDELFKGRERCRLDDRSYEQVRELVRLNDWEEFNSDDDAIAALLWIKFQRERERLSSDPHVAARWRTTVSQHPQLHDGLRNAIESVVGAEEGCELYRIKEHLTNVEEHAYQKGKTVQWVDNTFVWDNQEVARARTLSMRNRYRFIIKGVRGGEGAYFGRMQPPLPTAKVDVHELLLPDACCFKVSNRFSKNTGEDIGVVFIILEYTGEFIKSVDTMLNEDGCQVCDEAGTSKIAATQPHSTDVATDQPQGPLEKEIWQAFKLLKFDEAQPRGISHSELKVRRRSTSYAVITPHNCMPSVVQR